MHILVGVVYKPPKLDNFGPQGPWWFIGQYHTPLLSKIWDLIDRRRKNYGTIPLMNTAFTYTLYRERLYCPSMVRFSGKIVRDDPKKRLSGCKEYCIYSNKEYSIRNTVFTYQQEELQCFKQQLKLHLIMIEINTLVLTYTGSGQG